MSDFMNFAIENAKHMREEQRRSGSAPCECNVTKCKFYADDFLEYNCHHKGFLWIVSGCEKYIKFNKRKVIIKYSNLIDEAEVIQALLKWQEII